MATAITTESIETYRPLVRSIAAKVASRTPQHIDIDDLASAGNIGLVESAMRFDPSRGCRFESYACKRIRGSMIDYLRTNDWVPRSIRAAAREADETRTRLTHEFGRIPSDAEISSARGASIEDQRRIDLALVRSTMMSLEDALQCQNETTFFDDESTPESVLETRELRRFLIRAVKCLPERIREVVILRYFAELRMIDIAEVLGVTQSRVSQIHTEAVDLLRQALKVHLGLDDHRDRSEPCARGRRLDTFLAAVFMTAFEVAVHVGAADERPIQSTQELALAV